MAIVTIAALLAPAMLMAQSADACMTGGGAPGSLAAGPGAKGAQRYPIAGGSHPVPLLVTILEVKAGKGTASIYADGRLLAHRLHRSCPGSHRQGNLDFGRPRRGDPLLPPFRALTGAAQAAAGLSASRP